MGKTSAAVNLAALAARAGARTLLWDLDPQGGATYLFRVKPKVRGGAGKLLTRATEAASVIKATDEPGLDLLPADFSYRHMDLALDEFKRPTRRLARVLAPLLHDYDYVFLDCPPSISLVSESVFETAHALLVPVVPATLSSRTLAQLDGVLAPRPGTAAVLLHGRSAPAPAPSGHGRNAGVADRSAGGGDPAVGRGRAHGPAARVAERVSPRGKAGLAYAALWDEVRARVG